MHESSDIVRSLQDFGVYIWIDEIEELIKYLFDIADLWKVSNNQGMLC